MSHLLSAKLGKPPAPILVALAEFVEFLLLINRAFPFGPRGAGRSKFVLWLKDLPFRGFGWPAHLGFQ